MAAEKIRELDLAEQWSELTGYIKIGADNSIKIFCEKVIFFIFTNYQIFRYFLMNMT